MNSDDAFFMRTVAATIKIATGFDPVADYSAATMSAFGSQSVDSAFETVKVMGDAINDDLHRLVVVIPAHFTFVDSRHNKIMAASLAEE